MLDVLCGAGNIYSNYCTIASCLLYAST